MRKNEEQSYQELIYQWVCHASANQDPEGWVDLRRSTGDSIDKQ